MKDNKEILIFFARMFLGVFAAAFYAGAQVLWGVAGVLLFQGLITQYNIEPSSLKSLLDVAVIIIENWAIWFWSVFMLKIISNIFEFRNDVKVSGGDE